jgi:hypothetical protein
MASIRRAADNSGAAARFASANLTKFIDRPPVPG